MAKDQYIARLKSVPLFAGMSKKELDLMVRQADHLRYPARYTVVREGRPGEEFWLVVEGELAVERGGPRSPSSGRATGSASWPSSTRPPGTRRSSPRPRSSC